MNKLKRQKDKAKNKFGTMGVVVGLRVRETLKTQAVINKYN